MPNICLSHGTALACLRRPDVRGMSLPGSRAPCRPANRARGDVAGLRCPTSAEARELCRRLAPEVTPPLDVLVADASRRRPSSRVRPHVLGAVLRRRWLDEQPDGTYVCGPELCFAQAATGLDDVGLVELGFELCGSYALGVPGVRPAAYGLEALTCTRRLARELASMRGNSRLMKGASRALSALRFVSDGSASPRETQQAMMFGLPPRLGGYGLGRPLLNYRLEVTGRAREMTDSPYYVCDAYWPDARLDVEYDSDAFHTGADRIARDTRRRNVLLAMGVTVVTITAAQMRDVHELDRVACVIARCLGVGAPADAPDAVRRRRALWRRMQNRPL